MSIEIFPNELLLQCFHYLDGMDIYYAFDQLNHRFQTLIRSIPLYMDFQNDEKRRFNHLCTLMSRNPYISKQIYSLRLSNENTCQIHLFVSHFLMENFSNLRSLTLIKATKNDLLQLTSNSTAYSELLYFRLISCKTSLEKNLFLTLPSQLQILIVPNLFSKHELLCNISTVKSLTITTHCSSFEIHEILNEAYALEYLSIDNIEYDYPDAEYQKQKSTAINLKKLIIIDYAAWLCELLVLLKRVPNLESLTISVGQIPAVFDANQWQEFLTSFLPALKIFNFRFHYWNPMNPYNASEDFKQFQTDFWQTQHRWCTEYSSIEGTEEIYTIPYLLDKYFFTANRLKRCYKMINNKHSFKNIRYLCVCPDTLFNNEYQYYFPHVTSLRFSKFNSTPSKTFILNQHLEILKTMIDLNNIKILCIATDCVVRTSFTLLNILNQMPNISSLSMDSDSLMSLPRNDEVYEYLRQRIKKLDLASYCESDDSRSLLSGPRRDRFYRSQYLVEGVYNSKKLWETFSNIEQIKCYIHETAPIIFLMQHLPKLLRMEIWSDKVSFQTLIPHLEEEAHKLNMQITTNIGDAYSKFISVWLIRHTEEFSFSSLSIVRISKSSDEH